MNRSLITIFFLFTTLILNAQIGYQVSLLDAATGQPRADETVSVRIDLTDSTGAIVCSETKSATSDDFGVLSLTIGNASTFENFDWSRLPLYISATVDDILLGKSQVLNVPVAEYAKKTGTLTKEILMSKTWRRPVPSGEQTFSFNEAKATLHYYWSYGDPTDEYEYYKYKIVGDLVVCYNDEDSNILIYTDTLLISSRSGVFK